MVNPGGGGVPDSVPLFLPLGLGGGGLFFARDRKTPNRKVITIKNLFTIVFIINLKKQCELLIYNS